VTGADWLPPARTAPPWAVTDLTGLGVPASQWLAWLRVYFPAFSVSIIPAGDGRGERWTCTSIGARPFTASCETPEDLIAALKDAGYEPRPVERLPVTRTRRSA
jgi:hypothetical protein